MARASTCRCERRARSCSRTSRRGRRAVLVVNGAHAELQGVRSARATGGRRSTCLPPSSRSRPAARAAVLADQSQRGRSGARAGVVTASLAAAPRRAARRARARAAAASRSSSSTRRASPARRPKPLPELLRLQAAGVAVAVVRDGDDLAERPRRGARRRRRMGRALLVAALAAPLLAWSWMQPRERRRRGRGDARGPARARRRALVRHSELRWIVACVIALLVAGAIAFGVSGTSGRCPAACSRASAAASSSSTTSRSRSTRPRTRTHARRAVGRAVRVHARLRAGGGSPAGRVSSAIALVVGVGWPGTLLPGHDLLRGCLLLVARARDSWCVSGRARARVGPALAAGTLVLLAALAATSSPAFAKRAFIDWQHWDSYTKPAKPVDVSYVWNSSYDRAHLPRQADDRACA